MNQKLAPLNTQTPALVLSLFDTGLSIVHALSRRGIKVYGVSVAKSECGRRSSRCIFVDQVDPFTDPKPLLQKMDEIYRAEGRPIALFSGTDKFTGFMSDHRKFLEGKYLYTLSRSELNDTIVDKEKQLKLLSSVGVKVPLTLTFCPENGYDRAELSRIRLPAFIKPQSTPHWLHHYHVKGFTIESREHMNSILDEIQSKKLGVLIQELIPGPLDNMVEVSGYVDSKDVIRGQITTVKERIYPRDLGVGAYMYSTRNEEAELIAAKAVKAIGLKGFFNMELKRHEVSGEYEYIETNIRPWQQIALGEAADVPFIELAYRDVTGQELPEPLKAVPGKKWMDPVLDYYSVVKNPDPGFLDIIKWFVDFIRADVLAVFTWYDPLPGVKKLKVGREFIGIAGQTVKFFLRYFRKRFS